MGLVTALKAGKLVDTLSGAGPFTVFAPTNEAFAALPKTTLASLLDPKNIKELQDVLTYHVASGSVFAKDLKNGERIKTVEGKNVEATLFSHRVFINNAEVTTADIKASNGVVHIINEVLSPPKSAPTPAPPAPTPVGPTIVDIAVATPDLSTLVTALKAGKLVDTLSGAGPFTVFAPTNEAFAALPTGVLANLLKPANKAQLVDILTYHVHAGKVLARDITNTQLISTLEGNDLKANVTSAGSIIIDAAGSIAKVTTADILAANGVIHIIDAVLLPPKGGKTIVDLAVATPDLSTLVTAL